MSSPCRVAVLASGGGTDFQALIDRAHRVPEAPVRLVRLLASKPGIGAVDRAGAAAIPSAAFPVAEYHDAGEEDRRRAEEEWLHGQLDRADPDLVVLAGYLRKIAPSVVSRFRGRMLNIHPALLPSFGGKGMYGRRVHEAVRASGVRITGATIHFVDEHYDQGPIVAQWPVPVLEGDGPEEIASRVLEVEHRLLPAVVRAFARGDFELTDEGRCRWHRDWFGGARFRLAGRATRGKADGTAGTGGSDLMRRMEGEGT